MKGRFGPQIYGYYTVDGKECLVMELLGKSLDDMLNEAPSRKLKPSQVRTVAVQIIGSLSSLHEMGVVHKDMKPQNILWSRSPNAQKVYLIDFGISGPYRTTGRKHCALEFGVGVKGTLRYMSTHVQCGTRATRRDDLISLFYVLLQLCGIDLPWQTGQSEGIVAPRDEATAKLVRSALVLRYKMGIPLTELTSKVTPKPLRKALLSMGYYVLSLGYDETPDYERITRLFDCV